MLEILFFEVWRKTTQEVVFQAMFPSVHFKIAPHTPLQIGEGKGEVLRRGFEMHLAPI